MRILLDEHDGRVSENLPASARPTEVRNVHERVNQYRSNDQAGQRAEIGSSGFRQTDCSRVRGINKSTHAVFQIPALAALIENNLTLREVPLILNDPAVRRWLLQSVKDELCIEFYEVLERWSDTGEAGLRPSPR